MAGAEQEEGQKVWLLTVAYDGSAYAGWQTQPGGSTVQDQIDAALTKLFLTEAQTYGCSRTDAGVHALDQKVGFHPPVWPRIPPDGAQRALSHLLPADIRVLSVGPRPADFSVRQSTAKAYTYVLHRGPLGSPFIAPYCMTVYAPLQVERMRAATKLLLGTHDFTAFGVQPRRAPGRNPVKTLYDFQVREWGPFLLLTVVGNAFLYRMVRRLAGFLIAVGAGKLAIDCTSDMLSGGGASVNFHTARAQGLYLERVFFSDDERRSFSPGPLPFLGLLGVPESTLPVSDAADG